MAKKKTTGKPNARKKVVRKQTEGLSEAEHGQGWQRGEAAVNVLDESEYEPNLNGGPGDEDDEDDEEQDY